MRALRRLFTLPLRLYRDYLSPLKGGPCCRFEPSCSAYAIEAIEEWGILVGCALSLWRVLRCNPFGKGGRGHGRRERLETVMARQKIARCGLVQALRALDLLHFLMPEQEARFGQLNGLPRQQ